jgi:hypothetical protein
MGNIVTFNQVTFTGKNKGGLNRLIFLKMPINLTITNSKIIDMEWQPESFGILNGYPDWLPVCSNKQYYR